MREWGAWFLFAAALTAPAWARGQLLGHPDVDVWNHVWGLWWWAQSLAQGELPWRTPLLSHPHGGVVWFADPLGALAALPLTRALGPAWAWNLLLTARIAFAGFHARRFAAVLGAPGPHTLVAGVAFATSPYLLAELHNGISEVCATGWIPWVLARWWIAVRSGRGGDWTVAGAVLGAATWATPYYGAALVLALAPATVVVLRWRGPWRAALGGIVLAGVLGAGAVATWRAGLVAKEAVIQREEDSERTLARHNAVDLREPFQPGAFRSVDFAAQYGGEQFKHTLFLRLSVLGLVLVAVARRRMALAGWLGLAGWSLLLGLGHRPYLAGGYPWGESGPVLPFGFLVGLVPDMAITHPARLGVVSHAVLSALAAEALRGADSSGPAVVPAWRGGLVAAFFSVLVAAEGLFFSLATWPLPTAPTTVPAVYQRIAESADRRAVLDLPAQVRRTMATSVYFWYQTVHGHPVPWWPNVRAEGNGDGPTVRLFVPTLPGPGGRPRVPELDAAAVVRLQDRYGWVVVHPAFDRQTAGAGESTRVLTAAFGAPTEEDGVRWWALSQP